MQDEQFDEEHIYYQWLERKNLRSVGKTTFLNPWIWALLPAACLLLIPYAFWGSTEIFSIFLGYFLSVPLVEILIVFTLNIPRIAQEDFSSGTMQAILITDMTPSGIVADLIKWGIDELATKQTSFATWILAVALVLGNWPTASSLYILFIPVGFWILGRFFLGCGLMGAFLPRWISAGGLLLAWTLSIPLLTLAGIIIVSEVLLHKGLADSHTPHMIVSFIVLLVFYAISEIQLRIAPRLLELRRQGIWD
jgi:hypothetical protein